MPAHQEPPDKPPRPPLKGWVLPTMVGSIGVIVIGLISAYASLRLGAVIALIGLIGVCVAGWGAAGSSDS